MTEDTDVLKNNLSFNEGGSISVIAVKRIFDLIEAFRKFQRPLSLTELAEITDTPMSSCHALVNSLMDLGYLYSLSHPRALYPTRRLFDVSSAILSKDPLLNSVMPFLENLRDASGETVVFGKRQGNKVVYLQVVESPEPERYVAYAGELRSLHYSALGKAILGSFKESELRKVLGKRLAVLKKPGADNLNALVEEIAESRRRGYFVSNKSSKPGFSAISAFFCAGEETLGIAIAGPNLRIESRVNELAQLLLTSGNQISSNLYMSTFQDR